MHTASTARRPHNVIDKCFFRQPHQTERSAYTHRSPGVLHPGIRLQTSPPQSKLCGLLGVRARVEHERIGGGSGWSESVEPRVLPPGRGQGGWVDDGGGSGRK